MSALVLELDGREAFERNLGRSLAFGAASGLLHLAVDRAARFLDGAGATFPAPDAQAWVPLTSLALLAAIGATVEGDRLDRLLLWGLGLAVPVVPWLMGLPPTWALAVGGGLAGMLMVRARGCALGEERQVGRARPSWPHLVTAAGLAGALAVAGTAVARELAGHLAAAGAPAFLLCALGGAILSLFVALGSAPAHVALRPDPVVARADALLPRLSGELGELVARVVGLYRACGEALAPLEREPAREELARTLSKSAQGALELAEGWAGVEAQLSSEAASELPTRLAGLEREHEGMRDPLARRQLRLAIDALGEQRGQLEELGVQRERVRARLQTELALLERARLALIGTRGGVVQLRGLQLSALAQRLSALSTLQRDEGRWVEAVVSAGEPAEAEPQYPIPTPSPLRRKAKV